MYNGSIVRWLPVLYDARPFYLLPVRLISCSLHIQYSCDIYRWMFRRRETWASTEKNSVSGQPYFHPFVIRSCYPVSHCTIWGFLNRDPNVNRYQNFITPLTNWIRIVLGYFLKWQCLNSVYFEDVENDYHFLLKCIKFNDESFICFNK